MKVGHTGKTSREIFKRRLEVVDYTISKNLSRTLKRIPTVECGFATGRST